MTPTWAACVSCATRDLCSCARCERLEPVIDLRETQPTADNRMWLEFRDGFATVTWCGCGAWPAPPEVIQWHEKQTARMGQED